MNASQTKGSSTTLSAAREQFCNLIIVIDLSSKASLPQPTYADYGNNITVWILFLKLLNCIIEAIHEAPITSSPFTSLFHLQIDLTDSMISKSPSLMPYFLISTPSNTYSSSTYSSLVVIMILLPQPNQSTPLTSEFNYCILSISSRTKRTLLWPSIHFILENPLSVLPILVFASSPISHKSIFWRF